MSVILVALISIVVSLFVYLILVAKKVNRYFKENGIPYVEPYLFVGNALKTIFGINSQGEQMREVCDTFPNEPIVGYYDFMKPVYLVRDASVAEKVLIKDFPHFVDHGFQVNEEKNPLEVSLFNMNGKRWRAVRNKFSPIFTTGKLRNMFDQMVPIGNSMVGVLESELNCVEIKEILGRFSMDVIGSFAFGIDTGNLADGKSEFREMGKKAFTIDAKQFVKLMLITNFPSLTKKFGIGFNKPDVQDYFCRIIRDTLAHRRKNNVHRNDFVELMMQLQDKGCVEIHTKDPSDDYLRMDTDAYVTDTFELTDDLLIGQAFIFLTAGFEGAATIMTYSCYELSKNQDIQDKVRKEIQDKVKEQGGKLNFDSIKEMTYLDMCLKETMRKYPPAQSLFRVCTKDYTFQNGIEIKAGQPLIICPLSIHLNPQYYPDPLKFDPERFGPDVYQQPCAFIPFGEGPRMCIAMRFAIVQMKFGLAKLLMTYKFKLNPKTIEPLKTNKRSFLTTPSDPVYFDLEKVSA